MWAVSIPYGLLLTPPLLVAESTPRGHPFGPARAAELLGRPARAQPSGHAAVRSAVELCPMVPVPWQRASQRRGRPPACPGGRAASRPCEGSQPAVHRLGLRAGRALIRVCKRAVKL